MTNVVESGKGSDVTAVERILIERGAVEVVWNGDGSYTPKCEHCPYEGKVQQEHSRALAAARSHAHSRRHWAQTRSLTGTSRC